jgi:hypothetical protein
MTGELSNIRELAGALALAVEIGSAIVGAAIVAPRLASDRLDRGLIGVLAVLVQAIGVSLVLGMLGLLYLPAVLVLHVVLAAAAVVWGRRYPRQQPAPESPTVTVTGLLAVGASAMYFVIGLYYSLRAARPVDFDTREYHINNLASWLQKHSIWHLPYAGPGSITATHPGNGELFGLWVALPTHHDELVYATPLLFALLAILASAVIARELSGDRPGAANLGALAAVAVLSAPILVFTQFDSLSTDLPAAAGVLTALAIILVARRLPATRFVVLAGLALGLGLGSKYTALVPGALIALGAIVLLRHRRTWWWLVPGVVVFAGPWWIRNLVTTSNPLFPQAIGPLPGGDTPVSLLNTPILHHLLHGHGAIVRQWARLAGRLVGLVMAFIGAGIVAAVAKKRDRTASIVVAVIAVGAVVGFLDTPYSGGGPTGLASVMASCFRYGAAALLIGAALGAGVMAGGTIGRRIGTVLLAAVLVWNLWRVHSLRASVRPDLVIRAMPIAAGLFLGALAAFVLWVVGVLRQEVRPSGESRRLLSGASIRAVSALAVIVLAVGAGFAEIHRVDRASRLTAMEQTLLAFGPRSPAVVLGEGDLRSVLGPNLDRPLVGVSQGGHAHERPFADANQLRRTFLGDHNAPLPPAHLGLGLDAALAATRAGLLVVGNASAIAFPEGWTPAPGWCLVGTSSEGSVYAKATVLNQGGHCPAAPTPAPGGPGAPPVAPVGG